MAAFCVVITGGWCFAARQQRRNHHSRTCRAEPSRASDAMGICCCSNSCRKQQLLTDSHRFKHKLCEESYDQHRISYKLVPRLYYIEIQYGTLIAGKFRELLTSLRRVVTQLAEPQWAIGSTARALFKRQPSMQTWDRRDVVMMLANMIHGNPCAHQGPVCMLFNDHKCCHI